MIGDLARRLLCRAGRHHVIRCAGAADHRWTWDARRDRWTGTLVPPAPRPIGRVVAVEDGIGLAVLPAAPDEHTPVLLRGPASGIRHVAITGDGLPPFDPDQPVSPRNFPEINAERGGIRWPRGADRG